MVISRGRNILALCTRAPKLLSNSQNINHVQKKGHMTFTYRENLKKPTQTEKCVIYTSAIFWWWLLWHFFTEYKTLTGHDMPDPSKWTDEELGIPPLE